MRTGTAASKKATPRAAAGAAASKTAASPTEKKVAVATGGNSTAAPSGSSATHAASKTGAAGKTPRKSVEGSPSAGRRGSNSSTGASSSHEKAAKTGKTGATPRAAATAQKQAAAAAEPAADAILKKDTLPVEELSPPQPAATPTMHEAPPSSTPAAAVNVEDDIAPPDSEAGETAWQSAANAELTSAAEGSEAAPTANPAARGKIPLVCLLGPPCSGKNTLASLINQHFGLQHISTGDLLREAAKEQGEDGDIAESMNGGKLVTDNVVMGLLEKAFENMPSSKGAILDGFPRSAEQVKLMSELQLCPGLLLVVKAPSDVLLRRMVARRVDPLTGEVFAEGCEPQNEEQRQRLIQRDDDKPDILRKRIDVYAENIDAVCSSVRDMGSAPQDGEEGAKRAEASEEDEQPQSGHRWRCKIMEVDGDRDVKQIFEEVSSQLKDFLHTAF